MSRSLEFIQRIVCSTRLNNTSIASIRVSNNGSQGGTHITQVTLKFRGGLFDNNIFGAILHSGHYVEDHYVIHYLDSSLKVCKDSDELGRGVTSNGVDSVGFIFSYEKKPLLSNPLIKVLQSNTIFGFPKGIVKSFGAAKIDVFLGASSQRIDLLRVGVSQLRSYESCACTFEESNNFSIEIFWLDELGRLSDRKISIKNYLSVDLLNDLIRFSFEPKAGLKVYGLFNPLELQGDAPLSGWEALKESAETLIRGRLDQHLSSQIMRINTRVADVHRRRRVSFKAVDLGCEPINEVETVLLFQRMANSPTSPFPDGMEIKILDYSPKDIDSICEFRQSRNHPFIVTPIEFEFNLRNFFLHGHDYRQISLVICYTITGINFPFNHGGVSYAIDRAAAIPRIVTARGDHCFDCLILQDYLSLT